MGTRAKLLVVDDEEDIRSSLQVFLTEKNFDVYTAESAQQALDIIKKRKIDIVISDVVMPGGMNGITLTREIFVLEQDIPVILMTAYGSIESAVESMKAGAFDFITKPFKFNHTLFVVEKALERLRLRKIAKKSEYYKNLSNIDDLTNINNYRSFKLILKSEIKRHSRYKRNLSLLMADIDNFKQVNDTYGHQIGDIVLKKVAELLRKSIRGCDSVARYGGEEFTVILPETSEDEAAMVGERIVQTIQKHKFKTFESTSIGNLTVTVGLASFPKDAVNTKGLIDKADQALYEGKKQGKNRLCVYGKNK